MGFRERGMPGDAQVKLNGASRQRHAPPRAASPSPLHGPVRPRELAADQRPAAPRRPCLDVPAMDVALF